MPPGPAVSGEFLDLTQQLCRIRLRKATGGVSLVLYNNCSATKVSVNELHPHLDREAIPLSDRQMSSSDASAHAFEPFRLSPVWDVCIPFSIAAIPAGLFTLLGFVTKGLDKPNAEPATWVIIAMMILQTLGIIAMAVVVLMRFELGFQQLSLRTSGSPAVWRKLSLFISIVFVLFFDVLTNVAAAFAGAGPLLVFAAPIFIGYIFCVRFAFAGL
jgi:hypothetical protein